MLLTGSPTGALRLRERLESLLHVCQNARWHGLILTALCREKLGAIRLAKTFGLL